MSISSPKLRKSIYLGAIVLLFLGVSLSQRHLNQQREVLGLTRVTPLENAPPVLAFTTKALGGFRGIIANALWIRASDLQEDGKYFEMVQLSDWITKLEPNITTVWIHLAWNMSYNISIKFNDPEDRWMWVLRGIQLLRDEAIQYNPKEPMLYRELAWHFQHKLGHYLDDYHLYYKARWAAEFSEAIGRGEINWDELLNPQTPEAQQRVKLLREKFKMDPAWMKQTDEKYGPLEWRLPETHAIYWANYGLNISGGQELRKTDYVQLRRVIFQSLQLAFMRGRLIVPSAQMDRFFFGPNLEIIKQTSDSYLEQAALEPDAADNILKAHRNFVGTAVYHLFSHNRMQAAQEWFNYMKEKYPDSIPPAVDTVESYALARIGEDVGETDPNRVKTIIMGAFETAFRNYAIGEDDVAVNHELFARRLWQRYMQAIGDSERNRTRVGLQPLADIREETLRGVLSEEYGMDPILAAQLRTRLDIPPDFGLTPPSTNAAPALPSP